MRTPGEVSECTSVESYERSLLCRNECTSQSSRPNTCYPLAYIHSRQTPGHISSEIHGSNAAERVRACRVTIDRLLSVSCVYCAREMQATREEKHCSKDQSIGGVSEARIAWCMAVRTKICVPSLMGGTTSNTSRESTHLLQLIMLYCKWLICSLILTLDPSLQSGSKVMLSTVLCEEGSGRIRNRHLLR